MSGYEDHPVLAEQLAYYRARAREYDTWFRREGLHDLGEELNARWRHELDGVHAALDAFAPRGDVLELAYGTGEWTIRLAEAATRSSSWMPDARSWRGTSSTVFATARSRERD